MKRLILDQGLARSTARELTHAGWDVRHVAEIGMANANDVRILEFARTDGRICVTLDADFHALLATSGAERPSVVRVRREGLDGREMAALLESVWAQIGVELDAGAIATVTERAVRIRRLPISRAARR